MRAKEYLRRIRSERVEIKQLEERIEELNWSLLPSGIRYDKIRVQTSPDNQVEEICSQIDLCERQLKEHYRELMDRYRTGMGQVNRLENSDYRQVLTLYYFDKGLTWEMVAEKMHLSIQRIYQLNNEGLIELEKIWED